ncbi:MAG: dipeptide epimerase [Planctomycetota bacterium]
MILRLYRFALPLKHPFTIARGTTRVQQTLIVELEQDGCRGYGEAPETAFYGATMEHVTASIECARPVIESLTLADPKALWTRLRPILADAPFAQCALDAAAHDLWGKLERQPVWKLWNLAIDRCPVSDYTIGIDTIEVMRRKLEELPHFSIYKIKLGAADDVATVRALREHTKSVFRVDANCGWNVEQALQVAAELQPLNVEFIEQPLPPDDWDGMRRLHAESPLPLVADESCQAETDVGRCAGHFHGINIKIVKCGGLTPARRMIARARELGLRVMVGCFTESTVGISAIAQLLPLVDYADLDGALLLAADVARGVRVNERGQVVFPDAAGCGVELIERP